MKINKISHEYKGRGGVTKAAFNRVNHMNKKIILAIGFLILLVGGIFAWQYFVAPREEIPDVLPEAVRLGEEEFYAYVEAYREAIETNNPALLDPFPERVIQPITDLPINPRQSAEDFFIKTEGRAIGKWPGLIMYPRPNQEIESPIRLEFFAMTSHYNDFTIVILDENQNILGGYGVRYYSHWNLLIHHYVREIIYYRPTSRKGIIRGVAGDARGNGWTTFEIPIVFKDYLE